MAPAVVWAQNPASEYRSVYRGLTARAGVATGTYGQAIPGTVGAETTGLKSFAERQLLLAWDMAGGLSAGYAGNEHPGFWFFGGRLNLRGELGYRFAHRSAFSPYAGAGGNLAFLAAADPSAPAGGLQAMNNLDGLVGTNGRVATRFGLGGSYLSAQHALQLTGFAQEALRAPATWANSAMYFEVGVHAQYDVRRNLSLLIEALYGSTARKSEGLLDSTTEDRHMEVLFVAKKMFSSGGWVALDAEIAKDGNVTAYSGSPIVYTTSRPLAASGGLTLGIPIE